MNYSNIESYPQSYKIQSRWRDQTGRSLIFKIIGHGQKVALKIGAILVGVQFQSFPFNLAAGVAAWKAADVIKNVCDEMASLAEIENLLSKHDIGEIKAAIGHGSSLANKLKKYKNIEDAPDDLKKQINTFMNDNYKSIKELQSALQSADQRERKEVNVYLKKDKKSFKDYRMEQIKSAYKIKPANPWGDTPLSVILRIVAKAEVFVLRAVVPIAALAGELGTLGLGTVPLAALTISGIVVSGKIRDALNNTASLMDIENLLSKQDVGALRALIGKGTYLADKCKKYKTVGDMPPELQKDLGEYINTHYKTIRQLKDAIYTVDVKAKKSLLLDMDIARKSIDLPENNRFLI